MLANDIQRVPQDDSVWAMVAESPPTTVRVAVSLLPKTRQKLWKLAAAQVQLLGQVWRARHEIERLKALAVLRDLHVKDPEGYPMEFLVPAWERMGWQYTMVRRWS